MREYNENIINLEKEGKFDQDYIPVNPDLVSSVNAEYEYIPKNFRFKFYSRLLRSIVWAVGPLATRIVYGLKIKGKNNIQHITSGAIVISNHVLFTDSALIVRQAVRGHKLYCTAAPHNSKKGIMGYTLKAGGIMPFGATFQSRLNFDKALTEILDNGGFVDFHPEQSLWEYYRKPRPFKRGAFYYASKNNVPIIPVFLCFRDPKLFNKNKNRRPYVTAVISKPIYPDCQNNLKDEEHRLKMLGEESFKAIYEDFYKEKLN